MLSRLGKVVRILAGARNDSLKQKEASFWNASSNIFFSKILYRKTLTTAAGAGGVGVMEIKTFAV